MIQSFTFIGSVNAEVVVDTDEFKGMNESAIATELIMMASDAFPSADFSSDGGYFHRSAVKIYEIANDKI